jgi:peptide/nickel transport system ATP-binding protein
MNFLEVKNLSTYYFLPTGTVKAVEDVSFSMAKGEIMGLAGESGCGKTTVALSILRLIPFPGKIVSGEVLFEGKNILEMSEEDFRREMRWKKLSLIFQRAMQSLNPVFRIGDQIVEAIKTCEADTSDSEARSRAEHLLELVGIHPSRATNYPHEFSGGMRERAMIAMALACNPEFVIADEPTTGLDVIVQAQILQLIRELQQKLKLSMMLISHDLSVIAEVCNTCAIMYAGKLIEYSDIYSIFKNPLHPYTKGLLGAFPDIKAEKTRLAHIPGSPPTLLDPPTGCRFHPRCQYAKEICKEKSPTLVSISGNHLVACHLI